MRRLIILIRSLCKLSFWVWSSNIDLVPLETFHTLQIICPSKKKIVLKISHTQKLKVVRSETAPARSQCLKGDHRASPRIQMHTQHEWKSRAQLKEIGNRLQKNGAHCVVDNRQVCKTSIQVPAWPGYRY